MMLKQSPAILALDFDGVICDGMREYFHSSQLTYQKIWTLENHQNLDVLAPSFYKLRPVIETGWEMPVLIRALVLGISELEISQNWAKIVKYILDSEQLDYKAIAKTLDLVRDESIETDLEAWLDLHNFYFGVVERLQQILDSPIQLYIITTKEGRFVKKLLQKQGLILSENAIFGKEVKRPKYESLRYILELNGNHPSQLWFVEDFPKPLQIIKKQPDLQGIKLFLADWGYNTQSIRDSLENDGAIKLLSLDKFTQDFSHWL